MKPAYLIFRKDVAVLRHSPALLATLIAYPIVIAILIGVTATYANQKPRVALVDNDGLPAEVVVAGRKFHVNRTIDEVAKNVNIVRMPEDEARRQLESGRVVGTITIPAGFVATLQGLVRSPTLLLEVGQGGIAPRAREQMQALVYNLNLRLQKAYIEADIEYVRLLVTGGKGVVLGNQFDVLGLAGMERILKTLPRGPKLDLLREFAQDARSALDLTDDAIRATANPIRLEERQGQGRSWALSAQAQAYALGLTITFLGVLLAAGALASERDENVIGRLARGLVGWTQLVLAKIGLAAAVAVVLGLAIAVTFGVVVEIGGVRGGEPWQRLPLLVVGLVLAGGSLGAVGAAVGGLTREARTASLVGILVVLPLVFLGLVPRSIVPAAGWISDAFPFAHAVGFFSSALYDAHPWGRLGREVAWLAGLGVAYGAVARAAARRLAA